jgi:hypothetical protein
VAQLSPDDYTPDGFAFENVESPIIRQNFEFQMVAKGVVKARAGPKAKWTQASIEPSNADPIASDLENSLDDGDFWGKSATRARATKPAAQKRAAKPIVRLGVVTEAHDDSEFNSDSDDSEFSDSSSE